jgi:ribose transport system ATP-binding protein
MIYQELSLAPHLTVAENIALGMEPTWGGILLRSEIHAKTAEALALLGHADLSPDARVGSLSVAARQITEIARALAIGCKVLVLDEPTSSLTGEDIQLLFSVLRRLRDQGVSIIYISHFLEEVAEVSDRFTVLRDGRVTGSGESRSASIQDIVRMMIGRSVDQLYPRSPRTPGESILEVNGLAGRSRPTDAGFTLHRGEILGIAGLLGAGRTELLRTIFGLEAILRGTITIGVYRGPSSPSRRWLQGVGFLSEDRAGEGLAVGLAVSDNIMMGMRKDVRVLGFFSPSHHNDVAKRWIEQMDIRSTGPGQRVRSLSGGNQQKAALARLLYEDVDVLLLDEPTRGIDVASKSHIYKLLDDLAAGTHGAPKAILMVSSYLPELLGICDRIAVMSRGVLGRPKRSNEWTPQMLMLEATGQGAHA